MRTLVARSLSVLPMLSVLSVLSACGTYSRAELDIDETQSGCTSDDPRVGTQVALKGYAHGVGGRVAIVDDCTIELRDFVFDGGGLDVRAIGSVAGDFESGTILSEDLRRAGGYQKETVTVPLPVGVSLDDVLSLSIWCVPAGANFGAADLNGA